MKGKAKYMILAAAMFSLSAASAQSNDNEKFVIRATADMGIGNALYVDPSVENMKVSSKANDYGIEFGWRIWHQKRHSMEANVGLGYGSSIMKASIPKMQYHYSAPATADMDGDTYIRYYDIDGIQQRIRTERITLPLYVNYRYKCSKIFSINALFGFKFGFNFSSKIVDSNVNLFSYGVYPQYEDLLIDASYMNCFGASSLGPDDTLKPRINFFTSAFIFGLGGELRIWGPLSVGATIRYEGAMMDTYKSINSTIVTFDASNAPVTYTVADGQKVVALPNYMTVSKMSRPSYAVSLSAILRF